MKLVSFKIIRIYDSIIHTAKFRFRFKFLIAVVLAIASAAPSSYKKEYKAPEITIVSQSDERNLDGSSAWR